ncbi:MAG: ATP-grasp domain-containing protein [Candidatus Omnitrophota bacterium]
MKKNRKKILILGASRYYLRSIEAAQRLGYHTIVIDRVDQSPGFRAAHEHAVIDITDYRQTLAFAREKRIDGIAALNDYGVVTAAFVAENMGLVGLSTDQAKIATNKALMREKWEERQQPNPRFRVVHSLDDCVAACRHIGFPVILKPAYSAGGSRGVTTIHHESEIEAGYAFATSFFADRTVLVEELLVGFEHSAEVIVYQGKGHVLAISDKIKTPYPARVDKSVIYPTLFEGDHLRKIESVVRGAVEAVGIQNGCAHVECCTLPSGEVKLFEFGARPGGGGTPDPIVPFVTGINEIEQYLSVCAGDAPSALIPLSRQGCSYQFITPAPGRIRRIEGREDVGKMPGILDVELFVHEHDEVKPVRVGSDRSGFIIAGGQTREDAYRLGCLAESTIRFYYDHESKNQ